MSNRGAQDNAARTLVDLLDSCRALVMLLVGALFASTSVAQSSKVVTSIPPPPELVSASTVPGAFQGAMATWPSNTSDMDAAYFTLDGLKHVAAGRSVADTRYVLITHSKLSQFRFPSQQTFQRIVQMSRPPEYDQNFVNQTNASMKAQGMNAEMSAAHGEQVVLDEADSFAKIVEAHYNVAGQSLEVIMLYADVRLNGQLFIVRAVAPDDNAIDRTWLREKVVAWVRSLPAHAQ